MHVIMNLMKRVELDSYELYRAIVDYLKRWYPDLIKRNGEPAQENISIDGLYDSLDLDKPITARVDFPNGATELLNDIEVQEILNDEPTR